jgi:hypothetical protein
MQPDRYARGRISRKPDRWGELEPAPLALPWFSRYFPPAVAKTYVVTFRTHDDRRPSKFIVLADSMKSAIKMAWEHGGRTFNHDSTNPPDKPSR